jgi:hypothetical protein
MRLSPLLFVILSSSAVCAAEVGPDVGKSSTVDFSQEVLSPMGKVFFPCQKDAPHCDENTLRWIAYGALASPAEARQPGSSASPQDFKNQLLGYRIGASVSPVELTTDEKSWLKAAMFRTYNPGLAFSACLKIMRADECGEK